ncbi:MAG: AsmA family protein, partial [Candidatus Rokubacteria bacterium]|nr:AsmA family protein [Candidatus Rokubacteria bacterium]
MLRWSLIAVAALVLVMGALLAALPLLVDTPPVRAHLVQVASQTLGRPVTLGSVSLSLFPLPALRLRGLEVAEDPRFGAAPFLRVAEGRLRLRLLPLFSGRLELVDLVLEQPVIQIVESQGRLNLSSLGGTLPAGRGSARSATASPMAASVVLSRVRVADGTVRFERRGSAPTSFALTPVNLTLSGGGLSDPLELTGEIAGEPGGVKLHLERATVGPATPTLADAPVRARIVVEVADVGPLARLSVP